MTNKKLTVGCLFSGMGGFCEGFKDSNMEVIWANEKDENASLTFEHNFPDVYLYKQDIRNLSVDYDNLASVDVLAAGFPCQSFSQAGNRKGFEDERGALFFELVRLLKEFGECRPKVVLLENVTYLQYGDGGRWLRRVIREIQRAGYWFSVDNCQVLNTSKITDIPQNRERLFMVAFSANYFPINNFRFPKETKKLKSIHELIDRSKKADDQEYLPPDNKYYALISRKIKEGNEKSIFQLRKYLVREYDQICPTLTANMGRGGHNVPFIKDDWGIRRLQVEECLKFQGFDTIHYSFPKDMAPSKMYMQIGNTVTVPVVASLAKSIEKSIREFQEGDA